MKEYTVDHKTFKFLVTLCNLGLGSYQDLAVVDVSVRHCFIFNRREFIARTGVLSFLLENMK